uniref:SprT-like domain-containing protein n=1 Tax=Panagrolaimus superbus TaxID=310955 RepID=A0A914Z166_9BILA
MNLIDPSYELIDPNPDLHASFIQFNDTFFYGALAGCEVSWSNRMTQCAGLCSFQPRSGYCSIRLSVPLLKLRPRKDFVETLLHEMIHAFLFLTSGNRDRDGHGPEFQSHMHRINGIAGTSITIFHSFHAEVAIYKQHWWRCQGRCQSMAPYYGWVKRTMNRAPSKNDTWWNQHEQNCGGKYIKVKEPEPKPNSRKRKADEPGTSKIDSIFSGKGYRLGDGTEEVKTEKENKKVAKVKKPTTPKSKNTKGKTDKPGTSKIDSFFTGKGYRLGDGTDASADDIKTNENKKVSNIINNGVKHPAPIINIGADTRASNDDEDDDCVIVDVVKNPNGVIFL